MGHHQSPDEMTHSVLYRFARPDFRQEVQTYLRRWHLAVVEDNDISVNQQRGVESAMHEPGPFYVLREFGVHNFNNWLLDHMFPR